MSSNESVQDGMRASILWGNRSYSILKCWKQEDDKRNSEEFGVCDSWVNSYIMHVVATLVLIKTLGSLQLGS